MEILRKREGQRDTDASGSDEDADEDTEDETDSDVTFLDPNFRLQERNRRSKDLY